MESNQDITYIGETDFRNRRTRFGIKPLDRARHMYVIGKTGMGKSTFIENMIAQDILKGNGVAFIDPHGGSADKLLDYIPEHRIKDVIYFAPFDTQYPLAFNVMEDVGKDKRHLVANGLMSAFKKIWVDAWSARMEYILNNTILALLEYPGSTLLGINRMLTDKYFRKKVIDNITDTSVKSFWVDEYNKWDDRYAKEAGAAIQNKVGQFVSNPLIRNIVGQAKSAFDMREVMDGKKILIMNLSKGLMGEQNSSLIGGMLITKLYLAAMSRADKSESELKSLPPLYFYVDEFQSFANESFADILSEARKYKLSLTMAHQYVAQMPDAVRDAVFGNVGTMVVFRVGAADAEVFEREFAPIFTAQDVVNLGFAQVYLRLMIDGVGSKPFSARTLSPITPPTISYRELVIDASRQRYARDRALVESDIEQWFAPVVASQPQNQGSDKRNNPTPHQYEKNNASQPGFSHKQPVIHTKEKPESSVVQHYMPPVKKPIVLNDAPKTVPVSNPFRNQPHIQKNTQFKQTENPVLQKIPSVEQKSTSSISLKKLSLVSNQSNQVHQKPDTKTAKPETKNELRNLLASLTQEKVPPKTNIQRQSSVPQQTVSSPDFLNKKQEDNVRSHTSTDMHNNTDTLTRPQSPKEIPEELLKKILE